MTNVTYDFRRALFWPVLAAFSTWLLLMPLTSRSEVPADIQTLVSSLGKVQQVEVRYHEILLSGLLDTVISTNGKLVYEAPDHIRQVSEQGRGFQLDGDQMQLIDGGQVVQELKVSDIAQLKAMVGALRAIFAGDLETLKRDYFLDYRPERTLWTLELTPRSLNLSGVFQIIEIAGYGSMIKSIVLQEFDGDRRTITMEILSRTIANP